MQIENFSPTILIIQSWRHNVLRSGKINRHILNICAAADTYCDIRLLRFALNRINELIIMLIKTLVCSPICLCISQISIAFLQI